MELTLRIKFQPVINVKQFSGAKNCHKRFFIGLALFAKPWLPFFSQHFYMDLHNLGRDIFRSTQTWFPVQEGNYVLIPSGCTPL